MKLGTGLRTLLLTACATTAHAGAWLEPEGHGLLVTNATYFTSSGYYDASGRTTKQPTYQKLEVQPYAEYGLLPNLTLGATGSLQHDSQSSHTNNGLADPEFFLRTPLYKDATQVLSIQPLIKFESAFENPGSPRGGSSSTDAELSLLYGRNLNLLSPRDYIDIRGGYRYRTTALNDQWRADAALGLNPATNWTVTPAIRGTLATKLTPATSFSENGDQDYDLLKLELGVAYTLSPHQSVGLTLADHVAGRQTGNGESATISFAQQF